MRGNGGPNGVSVWWPTGLQAMRPGERAAALELGWWRDGQTTITRTGKVFRPCPDCGHDAEHDRGMCLFCHPPARPYGASERAFLNPFVGERCLRCDEPLSGLQERYCSDRCRKRANDKPRPNRNRYPKKVSAQSTSERCPETLVETGTAQGGSSK